MVEDRGEAAHDLAVPQVVGPLQEVLVRETDLPSPQVEGTGRQRHVLLQGPDGGLVVLGDVPVGALPVRLAVLGRFFLRRGALVHVEGHPDLEQLQGGRMRVFSAPLMWCSTSTVPSSPRRESGGTATVYQRLNSLLRS